MTCVDCAGRGWLRRDEGPWFKCLECYGSGERGTDVPEILTSDGRTVRDVVMSSPAKPKPPDLRVVRPAKEPP